MHNNVLYEPLPTAWNGYEVNTWFQIGVQMAELFEDDEVSSEDRMAYLIGLLFSDEDGRLRKYPTEPEELEQLLEWFFNGWNHDNKCEESSGGRFMDYYMDQGRIYADFMHIYHIDLQESDMHWWQFCWLLWNMPNELSSFKQVIEIRTKKPREHASQEERNAIYAGQKIYGLEQKVEYTEEEEKAIDSYDEMMRKIKERKRAEAEALQEFRNR